MKRITTVTSFIMNLLLFLQNDLEHENILYSSSESFKFFRNLSQRFFKIKRNLYALSSYREKDLNRTVTSLRTLVYDQAVSLLSR